MVNVLLPELWHFLTFLTIFLRQHGSTICLYNSLVWFFGNWKGFFWNLRLILERLFWTFGAFWGNSFQWQSLDPRQAIIFHNFLWPINQDLPRFRLWRLNYAIVSSIYKMVLWPLWLWISNVWKKIRLKETLGRLWF